jgi:Ohr subfamily peroxiredoxin
MTAIYTAKASATGGREGRAVSDDSIIDLKLGKPGAGGGTNPEQLFAAGYAACFGGALQHLAKLGGDDLGAVEIKSEVSLHKTDAGFHLSVVLDAQLPDLDQAKAVAVTKAAHDFCPYSKATRGNIEVTLKVNGQAI